MTVLQAPVTSGRGDRAARRVRPGRSLAAPVWVVRPLAIWLASRVLVLLATGAGALLSTAVGTSPVLGPWPEVRGTGTGALDGLLRWDSAWYLAVSREGYSPEPSAPRNAFFPLLPLLVRGATAVTGRSPEIAGLAVAAATGALATVLVWRLGRALADRAAADRMAGLFAFFPGSAVLSMVYAEGLLVALAAATLLALHHQRWLLAGVLAAVATTSRPNAVAVVAACGWAALVALARPRRWEVVSVPGASTEGVRVPVAARRPWSALAAPVLAGTGLVAFFAYLDAHTGARLAWLTAQDQGWRERVDAGGQWERVRILLSDPWSPLGGLNTWLPMIGLVVMAVTVLLLLRWRPSGSVVVYALAACAVVLVSTTIGARPRMLLGAFPLVMALAHAVRGPSFTALLGLSAGASAVLTVLNVATTTATP